ncbi:hypothetical protein SAMN05216167_103423 [Spirosoma endophyticum]|uniref:Uncharacterized protein n=1 Tax=Spirosoma endophyticum TaxID=662367 RepID=A0A1I1PTI3_9BACT|nr:hypothetical protein SAMN05216167_103423 [Spirosoma endophyticum]
MDADMIFYLIQVVFLRSSACFLELTKLFAHLAKNSSVIIPMGLPEGYSLSLKQLCK